MCMLTVFSGFTLLLKVQARSVSKLPLLFDGSTTQCLVTTASRSRCNRTAKLNIKPELKVQACSVLKRTLLLKGSYDSVLYYHGISLTLQTRGQTQQQTKAQNLAYLVKPSL